MSLRKRVFSLVRVKRKNGMSSLETYKEIFEIPLKVIKNHSGININWYLTAPRIYVENKYHAKFI